MLEIYGNLWNHLEDYDVIVITTNGFVKKNGEAVMGRGIALEAKERYTWLPKNLGEALTRYGNIPFMMGADYNTETGHMLSLVTLPVKPAYGPNGQPGWRVKADISLIEKSIKAMVELLDVNLFASFSKSHNLPPYKVLMPRPGCGNGGLKWEDVKPVIEPYLDDRFTVIQYKEEING